MRLSRRLLSLVALLALFHLYIGLRLLPPLALGTTGLVIGWLALLASCLMMPLAVFARSARDEEWSDRFAWVGLTTMGLFSSLLVFTLLRDIVLLISGAFLNTSQLLAFDRSDCDRDHLDCRAGNVDRSVQCATSCGDRRCRCAGREPAGGAARLFDRAISDVHVGPTIKYEYVAAIVDAVNGLDADVIAVTGEWSMATCRSSRRTSRRCRVCARVMARTSSPAIMSTTRARRRGRGNSSAWACVC
jgi:hypothetical protein